MKQRVKVIAVFLLFAIVGCQNATINRLNSSAEESVSYVTLDELTATLADESDVLLVEFCVPSGCARCEEMRVQMDRMASDDENRIAIRRVNLNQQPALAWELDVKVCPSYIAFRDGAEIYRAAYPTSADLIASELASVIDDSRSSQLADNDRQETHSP